MRYSLLALVFTCLFNLNSFAQLTINSVTTVNPTCSGSCNGSLTVNASGGTGTLTYDLNPGPVQTSNVFTGLCAGSYTVIVTDGVPTTAMTTVTISNPTPVTYTITPTPESFPMACNGSVVVNASGGTAPYTYTFYNSSMTIIQTGSSNSMSMLCGGTYYVSVMGTGGCAGTGPGGLTTTSFFINSGGMPLGVTTTGITNVTCNGLCNGSATITVTGGTPPYAAIGPFAGSPVTFTSSTTLTGMCAGNHTINIGDAMGMSTFVIISITQPTTVTFSASVTNTSGPSVCNGSIVVSASGGTGTKTYSKDGGTSYQASNTFSGLCTGTYNICVKDANNCVVCNNVTVGSSCTMVTTTNVTNVTCNGICDGTVMLLTSGGTPPYIFNHPVTMMPTTYTSVYMITGLCTGTYTVLVNDAGGCSNPVVFTVTEPPAISFTATVGNESPAGACNGTISISATGGTGSLTYSIDGGAFYQSSPNFSGLCAGIYNVCVQDANGCNSCGNYTVGSSGCVMTSSVVSQTDVQCNGDCNGMLVVQSTGGTMPYTVNHPNTGAPITYTSMGTIINICPGAYTLVINDAAGCSNTVVVTINEPSALSVSATPSAATSGCNGVINATGSGGTPGYVYTLNGGTPQASGSFTGLCAGSYTVCVMDQNGCETCTTVVVNTSGCTLVSTAGGMTPASCTYTCDGTVMVASSGGTLPYMLNHPITGMPMTYTSVVTINGLCPGVYTVVTQDAGGCFYTVIFTVTAPTALVASASVVSHPTAIGACDGVMTGSASGGSTPYMYYWATCPSYTGTGSTSTTATGLCEGSYALIVIDANGCMDTTACDSIIDPPTGISSFFTENTFSLYPNPTDHSFSIATSLTGELHYVIFDMTGKLVDQNDFRSGDVISTSGLQQGVYHIGINVNGHRTQSKRLIISR